MNNPKMGMCGGYWRNDKGQFHREDGPAIEWFNDDKEWWINGRRHREDGPAIEYFNGTKAWWYNDKFIGDSSMGFTQEDFDRFLKIKEY